MANYIVLHTHWDREWYFTTSDSLVLMDRTFKNIINELELYPELCFCLDGQYSIIEEFLSINPELEDKVKKLVAANRLQIGPWYTQTDTQLVSEESIVRNLYYGMNKTLDRFGNVMKVGYLPDTFGFCHQMPEIYNLAGIDKAVFWRGADFSDGTKPYFEWEGAGGSISKTINLFGGYGMAKGFSSDNVFIEKTLQQIISDYKQLGIDGDILIPVGNDQFEIKEDIPKTIEKINKKTQINLLAMDYEKSIDKIFEQVNFDKYVGEFRKTSYTRLHKSIGSVRYDLKKENYEAEQLLLNEVEPLFVIGKQFGIEPSVNLLYKAWSLLFEGHAHDGICGCVSDAVYDDMINRIKRAKEIAYSLKNLILKQITEKIGINEHDVLLINTSPRKKIIHEIDVYTEDEYVETEKYYSEIISSKRFDSREDALVETSIGNVYEHIEVTYKHKMLVQCELEPYCMKILSLKPSKGSILESPKKAQIDNGLVRAEVAEEQINICLSGVEYFNAVKLIDIGNDGDTYDYSPLEGDKEIEYGIKSSYVTKQKLKSSLVIELEAKLPINLEERITCNNEQISNVNMTISLYENDPKLYFSLKHNNTVLSHKLSVRINLGCEIEKTISSSAYGQIKRKVVLNDDLLGWENKNVEKPLSIETFDGFVKSINNNLTILSSFGKEYYAQKDYIELTVYATTGELGKSNLVNRPGRASGDVTKKGHVMIDTPKAQCLGNVQFDFALVNGSNDYFVNMKNVQDYRMNSVYYQVQEINKFEGRIDNKLMPYRIGKDQTPKYIPLKLDTNGCITSVGIDLKGEIIVRGVSNDDHSFESNLSYESIDLIGEVRRDNFKKFQIFNYRLKGEK